MNLKLIVEINGSHTLTDSIRLGEHVFCATVCVTMHEKRFLNSGNGCRSILNVFLKQKAEELLEICFIWSSHAECVCSFNNAYERENRSECVFVTRELCETWLVCNEPQRSPGFVSPQNTVANSSGEFGLEETSPALSRSRINSTFDSGENKATIDTSLQCSSKEFNVSD